MNKQKAVGKKIRAYESILAIRICILPCLQAPVRQSSKQQKKLAQSLPSRHSYPYSSSLSWRCVALFIWMVADLGRISIVGAWDKGRDKEGSELIPLDKSWAISPQCYQCEWWIWKWVLGNCYDIVIYNGEIELRRIAHLQILNFEFKQCSWK